MPTRPPIPSRYQSGREPFLDRVSTFVAPRAPRATEVPDGQPIQVPLEVVHDEAAVAVLGCRLAAKQADALDDSGIELLLISPLLHEVKEGQLVI